MQDSHWLRYGHVPGIFFIALHDQGQAAKKDSPYISSVWETLPITEKGKDEIDFSGLNAEV